jgi:hypothetical protein
MVAAQSAHVLSDRLPGRLFPDDGLPETPLRPHGGILPRAGPQAMALLRSQCTTWLAGKITFGGPTRH